MLGFAPLSDLPVSALPAPNAYSISALNGVYSVVGQTATLLRAKVLLPSNGVYALTGQTAVLAYTPVVRYDITALNGSYAVTGQSANVTWTAASPTTGLQQYIEIRSFTERRSFC